MSSSSNIITFKGCGLIVQDVKAKNKEGKTPWDYAQENEKLKGTVGFWALNDAQYNLPPQNPSNRFRNTRKSAMIMLLPSRHRERIATDGHR